MAFMFIYLFIVCLFLESLKYVSAHLPISVPVSNGLFQPQPVQIHLE